MMWFTADLHLGDTNILHDMDRPFDSVEEMNRKVIDAINECVAADDRLYILGDFTYRLPMAEAVRLRERIECKNATLIRGNHDGDWEDSDAPQIWEDVRDYLEIAPGYAKGHRLVMSHYPMLSWNGKARGAIMLHGHIHSRGDRTNARNRDRERKLMKKIEYTLKKLDTDDFGYCDSCGEEIGIRRLEARPTADLCIDCKTLAEIREKQVAG